MPGLGVTFYPFDLDTPALVRLGRAAESHGYDSVFVVEQGVTNDAMAGVKAIALATSRIKVGPGTANVNLRHPALLGAAAVAAAELSGGRLILGIGVNNEAAARALGLPWKDPRAALADTTEWLRRVFAGKPPEGVHSVLRAAKRPIPIHFAGVALETAALAGQIADGLMFYLATPARVRQVLDRLRAAAAAAGRPAAAVPATLLVPTFLSEDLAAARTAGRRLLTPYPSMPLHTKVFRRSGVVAEADAVAAAVAPGDAAAAGAGISDRMLDEVLLVGPLARCRERLAAFREAGADFPLIAPQPIGRPTQAGSGRA